MLRQAAWNMALQVEKQRPKDEYVHGSSRDVGAYSTPYLSRYFRFFISVDQLSLRLRLREDIVVAGRVV